MMVDGAQRPQEKVANHQHRDILADLRQDKVANRSNLSQNVINARSVETLLKVFYLSIPPHFFQLLLK